MKPIYLVECVLRTGDYEYAQSTFTDEPPADPLKFCTDNFVHDEDEEKIFNVTVEKIEHIDDIRKLYS